MGCRVWGFELSLYIFHFDNPIDWLLYLSSSTNIRQPKLALGNQLVELRSGSFVRIEKWEWKIGICARFGIRSGRTMLAGFLHMVLMFAYLTQRIDDGAGFLDGLGCREGSCLGVRVSKTWRWRRREKFSMMRQQQALLRLIPDLLQELDGRRSTCAERDFLLLLLWNGHGIIGCCCCCWYAACCTGFCVWR